MVKVILSSAIALFAAMTVLAAAAEACVSCQHTPMVVRGATTSDSAKPSKKKSVSRSTTRRKARGIKKRTVKRKSTAKKRIVKRKATTKKRIVKRKSTAKKVETVKTAPIKPETEIGLSAIATAGSLDTYDVGCKTLSVGCVVAKTRPSERTQNLGRLSDPEFNQLASDRREPRTLTRGAFGNADQ
jgi:hypothetical protein